MKKITAMAAAVILLAGCTTNDFPTSERTDWPMDVNAEVSASAATRAGMTTEKLQENAFLFSAVPQSDSEEAAAYTYRNLHVRYNDGWKFYESSTATEPMTLLWMDSTTPVQLTALYAPTDGYTLRTDQSSEDNLAANDWLHYSASVTRPANGGSVSIPFSHLNSLLCIRIEYPGEESVSSVQVTGTRTAATTFDAQELTGEPATIQTYYNKTENIYEAILLPQTTALGVTITMSDNKTYQYSSGDALTLERDKLHQLNLRLIKSVVLGAVTVTDWETAREINGGEAEEIDIENNKNEK